jgi:hypothetical protein
LRYVAPFRAVLLAYALVIRLLPDTNAAAYIRDRHLAFNTGRLVWNVFTSSVRVVFPALPESVAGFITTNWYMSPRRWLAVALGAAVLGVVSVHLLRRRSSWRPGWVLIPALAACFLLTQPVLGYTSVSLADTRDERFLYFPSVFTAIGAVYLAARIGLSRRTLATALGVWLALASGALWHVNGTWADAGRLTRTIAMETSARASAETVVVANVPERYRGAWVFRNGFREAVTIFNALPDSVLRLELLSMHPIRSASDSVLLRKDGESWSVEMPSYGEPLIFERPDAPIQARSAHGFSFALLNPDSELLYYSAGRVIRAGSDPSDRRE